MSESWSNKSLMIQLSKIPPHLKPYLIENFNESMQFNLDTFTKMKHSNGVVCPTCLKRSHIVKYGRIKAGSDRRRYYCNNRSCDGKSFNDYTNTIFHRTKHLEKWPIYLEMMSNGKSIRACAEKLNISPTTSHNWRKKILKHIDKHQSIMFKGMEKLEGIVEIAEMTVKTSQKGLNKVHKEGLPQYQTLLFAVSRDKQFYVEHNFKATQDFKRLCSNAVFYGDQLNSEYLTHLTAQSSKEMRPANLHLLTTLQVDQFRNSFTHQYAKMRGVATTYLPYYAKWHQVLTDFKSIMPKEKLKILLRLCL